MLKFGKKDLKTLIMVIISSFCYSVAMKAFVDAGNLFPGGFAGLSTLISRLVLKYTGFVLPFGVIYFILNAFPTVLVFRYVGKKFTIFSVLQYTLTSVFTALMPAFPVTDDLLLIAVFGGIVGGFAISVALRAGASSGGTDFLAIYFSNKYNAPTWSYVMAANAVMLATVGVLFSWEQALYSIIYQFCSTQIVSTLHQRYKLDTMFIVTKMPNEVSDAILHTCRHGITRLKGEGVYSHSDVSMLYMTVNAYQVDSIVSSIRKIDPHAFITISRSEKIVGNYYQVPLD